jgi:proteasome beta subunit
MLHAGTVLRMGWKRDMTVDEGVELTARALWEASDADSATGGPDALRGIYPVIASITSEGFARVEDAQLKVTYEAIAKGVGQR